MKKNLLVLFWVSIMILLNGCSSSEKNAPKVVSPVTKIETKPVLNEILPEIKEIPTNVKIETKTEEKTTEKPAVIIVVVSKEEASEIIKSIMPNTNYEIKGLNPEPKDTPKENVSEIKIETKTEPVVDKAVKEEEYISSVTSLTVLENETAKVEKKEIVTEKVLEKVTEESNSDKVDIVEVAKIEIILDKNADADKDGIPDYLDSSPNQVLKETLIAQGIQNVIITDDMKEMDTALTSQMMVGLDKISAIMKKDKTLKIRIVAHTNNIGSEAVNMKLSEKRANMAETYLNSKGIPLNYVTADWKGGTVPMVNNDTKENRAINKRLEVIFYTVNLNVKK